MQSHLTEISSDGRSHKTNEQIDSTERISLSEHKKVTLKVLNLLAESLEFLINRRRLLSFHCRLPRDESSTDALKYDKMKLPATKDSRKVALLAP